MIAQRLRNTGMRVQTDPQANFIRPTACCLNRPTATTVKFEIQVIKIFFQTTITLLLGRKQPIFCFLSPA